jgi:porphobilinogen synthase
VVSGEIVDRSATISALEKISVTLAGAGAHVVMPSGMTAGAVAAIRSRLDGSGFNSVKVFSVSGKFASSLFEPFRAAADCRPVFGDKRAYQLDVTSAEKALERLSADVAEGADAVVVKPALAYLDIVALASKKLKAPVGVFNVSGEYAMLKAAAMRKWIDETAVLSEILECFVRAGADFLISYHAPELAKLARMK